MGCRGAASRGPSRPVRELYLHRPSQPQHVLRGRIAGRPDIWLGQGTRAARQRGAGRQRDARRLVKRDQRHRAALSLLVRMRRPAPWMPGDLRCRRAELRGHGRVGELPGARLGAVGDRVLGHRSPERTQPCRGLGDHTKQHDHRASLPRPGKHRRPQGSHAGALQLPVLPADVLGWSVSELPRQCGV